MSLGFLLKLQVCALLLNLLPVPPLDGGRIAVSLLPARLAYRYARIEPYGMLILMGAILLEGLTRIPLLGAVLFPPYELISRLILAMVNLQGSQ